VEMLQHLSVVKVTLLRIKNSLELVVAMVLSAGPSTGETTLISQRLNAEVLHLVQLYHGVTKEKHFALCNAQLFKKIRKNMVLFTVYILILQKQ
jgi:hypothetical protein